MKMVPFDRKVKYTFFFMVQPKKDLLIEIFLLIAYTESGYSEARLSKFRHFGTILKVLGKFVRFYSVSGKILILLLQKMFYYWASFRCFKWPNTST